ncbi:MAG TPA: hypothetical protein VH308_10085 [Terracidiphilus sp.]|nr:hypothetical protein [Terracidiphilus sp.]
MNTIKRSLICALFATAALCASTLTQAQSPFDGTWRLDMSQAKFSPKPLVSYLSQGWYHCVSCTPAIDVQADGQDHPVAGQPYDSISVTVVDPHTLTFVTRKAGKMDYEQTRTVSADGKTLTVKTTFHPINSDQPVNSQATAKLVGIAPAGVHATSGNWQILKVTSSDNDQLFTYKTNVEEITMTEPTGESYTAKFDGADYPAKGSITYNAVSLKRINPNSFEETDKRDGKVVDVSTITVAAGGKTMTIVDTAQPSGRVSTFTAKKQ